MIDRTGRDALSFRLRQLASGRITTDTFDNDRPDRSEDEALVAIGVAGWGLYSDFETYRLRGRRALDRETLEAVARSVLFLDSDLPYEWTPLRPTLLGALTTIVTLGYTWRRDRREWRAQGPHHLWPFMRESDYQAALAAPRRLHGRGERGAA